MDSTPVISVIDIATAVLLLLNVAVGFYRGLSGELARLVGMAVALVLAMQFYRPAGVFVLSHTRLAEKPAEALAYTLLFICAFLVSMLVRILLRKVMKVVFEQPFDKIGGCVAGLVRSSAFIFIVFVVMNMVPHEYLNRKFGEESLIGRQLLLRMPELREEPERTELLKTAAETVKQPQ